VGGVGLDQLRAVAAAGAAGFAAISLFADPTLERLPEIVRTARAAFNLARNAGSALTGGSGPPAPRSFGPPTLGSFGEAG